MHMQLSYTCFGRRCGFTTDQKVGIFPAATKQGDLVAVLHGGLLLYVIRPCDNQPDKYTFVGECYVEGLMDGQAMHVASEQYMTSRTLRLV